LFLAGQKAVTTYHTGKYKILAVLKNKSLSFTMSIRGVKNVAETKGFVIVFSAPESCDET
jgi:hypothetical protein